MDPRAFPSRQRGTVRRTLDGYYAFFPEPLPRSLSYSPATVHALDKATASLHRLAGVGRLLPNPALLMVPHMRLEAVLSSRIEGTKSGVADLLRLEVASQVDGMEDAREVRNYMVALGHGIDRLANGLPLSIRLLREVHGELMRGVRGEYATPGDLRRSQNWIGGATIDTAVFVPPPRDEMRAALSDWERFLHIPDVPLLVQLALAHYQFEVIHPFLDGNGRVGRLLIPLVLAERGVLAQPLLYLSAFFERHRAAYYDLLLSTSQTGEWEPWLLFFLEGVRVQATDAENRTVRLVELQSSLRDELFAERRTATVIRLAESLLYRPLVTAPQVRGDLGVSKPTAQLAIDALVERGTLEEISGRKRGRIYLAPAIYDAIYGDVPEAETVVDA